MPVNGNHYESCEGEGYLAIGEINYRVGTCPVCSGQRTVDRDGAIEAHTIKVIDCGGDDDS